MNNFRNSILWIVLFSFLIFTLGCTLSSAKPTINFQDVEEYRAPSLTNDQIQPIRVAISPVLSKIDTISYYRLIVSYVEKKLGRPAVLIQRQSNSEVNVLLENGGVDIAFFSSGAYASYNGYQEIEPLVMQQRKGVNYYQAYIIVPKSSTVKTLNDLRGKSFAFTDPLSFSGHLALVNMLKQKGETPENFFSHYIYTYSHDKALRAAANKVVDGATVDSLVYDYAKSKNKEIAEAVRIISVSKPLGTGPVVVRKNININQKALLRSIFLNMHEEPSMKPVLKELMIDKFVEPQPELYEYAKNLISEKRLIR